MGTAMENIQGHYKMMRAANYYLDILPLLKQWAEEGIPQKDQAGLLNGMGKVNFDGLPYTQVMISRVLKRAMELGQVAAPQIPSQ